MLSLLVSFELIFTEFLSFKTGKGMRIKVTFTVVIHIVEYLVLIYSLITVITPLHECLYLISQYRIKTTIYQSITIIKRYPTERVDQHLKQSTFELIIYINHGLILRTLKIQPSMPELPHFVTIPKVK